MNRIQYGNISEWSPVKNGQTINFETNRPSRFKFECTTNSLAEIWVSNNKNMKDAKLVGMFTNYTKVEFATLETAYVLIKADKESDTFVKLRDIQQIVENSDLASYTNIEPRTRGQSSDMEKVMKYVQINEQRRERELNAERAELRQAMSKLQPQVVDGVDVPPLKEESLLKEEAKNDEATE